MVGGVEQAPSGAFKAYRSNGQFLWSVNTGPNSTNQNNIEGGSSTIDVGHNDGVTVYDLDNDGTTWTHSDNNRQFIAILDGRTGALRNWAAVPTDYLSDGPMYARFGVDYLDGATPSLVAYMKNRSHHVDYFLGAGMTPPPRPNISH